MLIVKNPKREGQRGASLVELTLVLFFLLVMIVGVIDFARAMYSYVTITNAAREGARYAARLSHHADGILEAVKEEAAAGGLILEDDDIEIDPNSGVDGDGFFEDPVPEGQPITVTVSYPVNSILGHIIGFDTVPLQARTQMVVVWTDPNY